MDAFKKSEMIGRELFVGLLEQARITDYQETEDIYNSLDMVFSYKDMKIGAEIKVRAQKYQAYSSYVMDLSKYSALIGRLNSKEFAQIYYVNFFGSDSVCIFNLKDIYWGIKKGVVTCQPNFAPVKSVANYGKIEKMQLFIPKELGIMATRTNNKWHK